MIPELRLFGGATLIMADGRLVSGAAAQPRRVAVLAVLADAWPAAVTRDRLIGLIWPDHDAAGARRLLTQALYSLRSELGDVTRTSGRDIALNAEALRVDLIELRRALAAGEVERAAALYRGPFLDGVHLRDALEFERWCDAVRDESRRRFQEMVESLVARHATAGRAREAARWGERLVETAPFETGAVIAAMELWERAGDRGAAVAAAAAYERRMLEILELEPDPAVQRRVAELRWPVTGGAEQTTASETPSAASPAPVSSPAPSSAAPSMPLQAAAPPSPPARGRPPASTRRRATWIAAGVAAAIALAAGLALELPARRATDDIAPPARTVTLLPFQIRADSRADASFGAALMAILAANLDGTNGVRVVRAATDSAASASWAVLRGTVVATGDQLRLDAELRPSGGAGTTSNVSVRGPRDSLLALAEQLSLQLLPRFYPELGPVVSGEMLRRFHRVAVLERHLDGESALRRGDFSGALASFRVVTEQQPGLAWSWYRRAAAAELAHRNDDADRSIATAESLQASLPERERQLLHGYSIWRRGDARGAEPVFRHLVETEAGDREAWFQFAEIAYHAGPLLGRPLDAARDPWRQVVALDSGNFPALMHAVRLEARARDTLAVAALLRRIGASRAAGAAAQESYVIAAHAVGDRASVERMLDTLPDYSLEFLHAVIAGQLEQPDHARAIARRLINTSRPDVVRAEGHIALATLAMAQGRWTESSRELDLAAPLNPVASAWSRAYLATLPFVELPDSARDAAARALRGVPDTPAGAPLYLQLAVEAPAAPVIRRYMAEQLRLAGSRPPADAGPAPRGIVCATDAPSSTADLCLDLRLGLEAEALHRDGDDVQALRRIEAMSMRVPYQFAARSVFFARTRERYLRAELLARQGRLVEANRWYASVPDGSRLDYVYLAPTHLRRGQIQERLGDRAAAARHFRRALELWRDADVEFIGLRRDAEAGLRRVSARR